MSDPTPDLLVLHSDGTATLAWSPTAAQLGDDGLPVPGSPTFVPAWFIRRPVVRELRALTALWHELLADRRDAQLRLTDEARRLAERIKAGEDMTDVEVEKATAAANDMVASTEAVAWPWWQRCAAVLGTRIGEPWPREPDDGDSPPWLTQNSAVFTALTMHWQTAPLARGSSPSEAPTVSPLPIQRGA